MKNIKKYILLVLVLVIACLGFVYRENIARAIRGDAYVDNKIYTKQLEKAQKSGKDAFPQLSDKVGKDEAEVILQTSKGDITVKLFPTLAPKASENFLKHAKDKYYDGLTFHRVIQDFMIQSGDPKGDGTGGESIWKKGFALSQHHSSTTFEERLPWQILVLRIQMVANSSSFKTRMTKVNNFQVLVIQNLLLTPTKKVDTQPVIPNIPSLDKSSKGWMSLIPLPILKSIKTTNQKKR